MLDTAETNHYFEIVGSVWWEFFTDVSGQPVDFIFGGQEKGFLNLADGKDRLFRNVGVELPLNGAQSALYTSS